MIVYEIHHNLAPIVKDVPNEIEALQKCVGGYIKPIYLPELIDKDIVLLANEEGVLKGLPVNENLQPFFYVGDVIAVGVVGEHFIGLAPFQIVHLYNWLEGLKK